MGGRGLTRGWRRWHNVLNPRTHTYGCVPLDSVSVPNRLFARAFPVTPNRINPLLINLFGLTVEIAYMYGGVLLLAHCFFWPRLGPTSVAGGLDMSSGLKMSHPPFRHAISAVPFSCCIHLTSPPSCAGALSSVARSSSHSFWPSVASSACPPHRSCWDSGPPH